MQIILREFSTFARGVKSTGAYGIPYKLNRCLRHTLQSIAQIVAAATLALRAKKIKK